MQKNNIANTQVFYLIVVYVNCTHKCCNIFFESCYSFKTFAVILYPEFVVLYIFIYSHKHEKHNTSGLLSGVAELKEIFIQKD